MAEDLRDLREAGDEISGADAEIWIEIDRGRETGNRTKKSVKKSFNHSRTVGQLRINRLSPSVDKDNDTVIRSEDGNHHLTSTEKSQNRKRKHQSSDKHKHRRKSKKKHKHRSERKKKKKRRSSSESDSSSSESDSEGQ
ncbi:hypothetical protein ACROYT_G027742 [Oculina patagonica]